MTTKTNSLNRAHTHPSLIGIPEHLQEYITEQDPTLYTNEDHAVWRFIMSIQKKFFKDHAHPLYFSGLEATGIPVDRIPLISEMDAALQKMGWRAVAINGFIPPSIFLEFQSLKILAIACDMRKIENLGYTPSPDIVHEAAGHAPIVSDPAYRSYLESYGQVARNAIISKQDVELYDAIYELSEIKENPKATDKDIWNAQTKFEQVASTITEPSEASLLARMAWWTTEYGLIDVNGKFLIYGAGLLSSISESFHSVQDSVKKVPFSLQAAISTSYDITRPQPQLFVARNFESLTKTLEEFANQMCFRKGGASSLEIAKNAGTTVSVVLDSGIQLSGIVSDFEQSDEGEVLAFKLSGAKQIAYHEIANHDVSPNLFSNEIYFPLFDASISTASIADLQKKLHASGLQTKSGCRLTGYFKKEYKLGTGNRLFILENVKVKDPSGKIIFQELTKPYPLLLGSKVTSVFGGAADRKEFALRNSNHTKKVKTHKTNRTAANLELDNLYGVVREMRDKKIMQVHELGKLYSEVQIHHPSAWLIRFEILELYLKWAPEHQNINELRNHLFVYGEKNNMVEQIQRGLELFA